MKKNIYGDYEIGQCMLLSYFRKTFLVTVATMLLSGTAIAAISYSLNPFNIPSPVFTGDPINISISFTNYNFFYTGICAVRLDDEPWPSEFVISAGSTLNQSITIKALPWESGSGSARHTIYTYCYDVSDPTLVYKNTSFNLTYRENPEYIKSKVTRAIDSALTSINNAQNGMDEAKNLGVDTGIAEINQTIARGLIENARMKQSSMNMFFTVSNYDQANITAGEAISFAGTAKIEADNAYYTAIQAKIEYDNSEEGRAKSKLAAAQSTYENAIRTLEKSNETLMLLPDIGIETLSVSKELEKVLGTLAEAKEELDGARASYENKEIKESRNLSEKALDTAETDIIILDDIQNDLVSSAIDSVTGKYSSASSNYDTAAKFLDESKTKINEDIYISKNEKLEASKESLDNASRLISQAKSYADNRRYPDSVISLKNALSEIKTSESLSNEVKPESKLPLFEASGTLGILFIIYVVLKKKKYFTKT